MRTFVNVVFFGTLTILLGSGFYACKREVSPRLNITVTDTNNRPLKGAEVRIYHGAPAPTPGTSGFYNDDQYDQKKSTSSSGVASFDVPNSAVLDVTVVAPVVVDNPPFPPMYDTLIGKKVVKVELKWQRSKDNEVNETVEVR